MYGVDFCPWMGPTVNVMLLVQLAPIYTRPNLYAGSWDKKIKLLVYSIGAGSMHGRFYMEFNP